MSENKDGNESQSVIQPMISTCIEDGGTNKEYRSKKREKLMLKLKISFPFIFVLVHSILVIGLSVRAFIVTIDESYKITEALMVSMMGTYFIITEFFTLILINRLNYGLYVTVIVLHYIGLIISIINRVMSFTCSFYMPIDFSIVGVTSLVLAVTLQLMQSNKFLRCCSEHNKMIKTSKQSDTNIPIGTIQSITSPTVLTEMFDTDGKGVQDFLGWYICNGKNGTPDLTFRYTNHSEIQFFNTNSTHKENYIIAYAIFFDAQSK